MPGRFVVWSGTDPHRRFQILRRVAPQNDRGGAAFFLPLPSVIPAVSTLVIPTLPLLSFPRSPFCHSRRFLAGIHLQGEKRKDPGCPIKIVGHDRRRLVGHDSEMPPLPRPSRRLPLCHSRRFLAGIHLQREKRKDPGCPIKTVGHDRRRLVGHDSERSVSVLPVPERKTVFLLFPTRFGHYFQNDVVARNDDTWQRSHSGHTSAVTSFLFVDI